MGRLVREGLDRHDPARPPRGRRTGSRSAGAEQTSAAKTQAASARGAASAAKQDAGSNSAAPSATKHEAGSDSAVPSAAKVSAPAARQPAGQPGDEAAAPLKTARVPDRPDTSAATPAGDATSAPKMKTRRLGRPAAACAKPAAPPRTQLRRRRRAARPAAPSRQRSSARSGGAIGAAAATWTAPAGAVAARDTCCRSITSCRMLRVAAPSRAISACCAPRITATATPAPDSAAAPARIVRRRVPFDRRGQVAYRRRARKARGKEDRRWQRS